MARRPRRTVELKSHHSPIHHKDERCEPSRLKSISPAPAFSPVQARFSPIGSAIPARAAPVTFERLQDIGDKRIAEMDAAGIDMQVLSLNAPGVEQAEVADQLAVSREANDFLADAVKKHPTRFAGFASLPIAAPDKAAEELERTVKKQNFKGALINGHSRGRYLDDKFFWPILECAVALNVPIYLHPTVPPKPVVDAWYGGFAPEVTAWVSASGWGWHIETAVHLIRMILGGVFDRFPNCRSSSAISAKAFRSCCRACTGTCRRS